MGLWHIVAVTPGYQYTMQAWAKHLSSPSGLRLFWGLDVIRSRRTMPAEPQLLTRKGSSIAIGLKTARNDGRGDTVTGLPLLPRNPPGPV